MSLQSSVRPADGAKLVRVFGGHLLRVLQDEEFQAAVRREAWKFVTNVASEARAAYERVTA